MASGTKTWEELDTDVQRLKKEKAREETQRNAIVDNGHVYDYKWMYAIDCQISEAEFWRANSTLSKEAMHSRFCASFLNDYNRTLKELNACTTLNCAEETADLLNQFAVWFSTLKQNGDPGVAFPDNPGNIVDAAFAKKKAELRPMRASIASTLGRVVGLCDF